MIRRRSEKPNEIASTPDELMRSLSAFSSTYASKNRTASETKRIFRRYVLPKIGKRSIHDLTRADINDLISDLAETAPTMANRVLAAVRKFFNWAYSKALIEESPCAGISAPSKERQRDRLLSDDELVRVVSAARISVIHMARSLNSWSSPVNAVKKSVPQAGTNLISSIRTWTIPASRSKNGKAHIVHLSDAALRVLERCPKSGSLVFSLNGHTPFQGFSKAKTRLDHKSGVSGWRLHDFGALSSVEWRVWESHRTLPTRFSIIRQGQCRAQRRCINDINF